MRTARDYATQLDAPHANQLARLERTMDRESYLLADKRWWPETLPALFYQQFFNQAVETGKPFPGQKSPACWIHQARSIGATDQALLRILAGHTGSVYSVAFSPDGQLLLTGSGDHTARLWEGSSGQLRATLQGHTGKVFSVAFSPDGRLVLTGSGDKTARPWESSSGQLRATLQGHTGSVHSVAFSPDGRLALTSDINGWTFFWHIQKVDKLHASASMSLLIAYHPCSGKTRHTSCLLIMVEEVDAPLSTTFNWKESVGESVYEQGNLSSQIPKKFLPGYNLPALHVLRASRGKVAPFLFYILS